MRTLIWSTLVLVVLAGCRGTTIDRLVEESYPPHEDRVCILAGQLPPAIEHRPIATVTVKPRGYGGDRKAKAALAKVARSLGARVVQQTSYGNTMGAAEGTGVAVVLVQPDGAALPPDCEWY